MHQQCTMMKWKHFTSNDKKSSTLDKKESCKENGTNFWTDALKDWKEVAGSLCNKSMNDKGLRMLEFARYNNVVLANTLNTKTHNDGPGKLPIIFWCKRGFDRCDNNMVMMNFKSRLRNTKGPSLPE